MPLASGTRLGRYEIVAPIGARSYDVAPDGQRFLMIKDLATADEKVTPPGLVVVERWFEELKARLPAR